MTFFQQLLLSFPRLSCTTYTWEIKDLVVKCHFELAVLEAGRSIPSTRCPQSYLGLTLMRVRSRPVDVNKSTSEGSLSRSARRPCSGAEGRRAMAPRVSRQGAEPSTTRPRLEGHFLEQSRRSLRQNASDVVRSQFVKFGKARGNAGV